MLVSLCSCSYHLWFYSNKCFPFQALLTKINISHTQIWGGSLQCLGLFLLFPVKLFEMPEGKRKKKDQEEKKTDNMTEVIKLNL